jgi:hypothetical protein
MSVEGAASVTDKSAQQLVCRWPLMRKIIKDAGLSEDEFRSLV